MATINTATATGGTSGGTASQLSSNIMAIYSQEVLFKAQPILRFEAFASRKEELGVAPGLTVNFLRYNPLEGGGALTENTDLVTTNITTSLVPITVVENGNAIAVTELLLRSSFTDVMSDTSLLLGQNLARYRDGQIRDALISGTSNHKWANNHTRTTLLATDFLSTDDIREVVETLATAKAPKIGGDAYVMFIHPHQARYLRRDPDWINAANYGAPTQRFVGEVGRFEDVRFVETTMVTKVGTDGAITADSISAGHVVGDHPSVAMYQAIAIGDHAIGLAISLEAQLRDNGIKDFGRRHELAWYGIWGSAVIEAGHSCVIETA